VVGDGANDITNMPLAVPFELSMVAARNAPSDAINGMSQRPASQTACRKYGASISYPAKYIPSKLSD